MKRNIILTSLDTRKNAIETGQLEKKIKTEHNAESTSPIEKDYEPIWNRLKVIANNLVVSEHNLYDQRERINDVLFVASQDPDKMTFFDVDYGSLKVETAIKEATKLLFSEGTIDLCLNDYLRTKRNELVYTLNVSYLTKKSVRTDFNAISKVANDLLYDYVFNFPTFYRKQASVLAQRFEFIVLMTTDPSSLRKKKISLEIGTSKIETAISICTHILEGVKENFSKHSNESFRRRRNKKIQSFWNHFMKHTTPYSNETFKQVRRIVTKNWKNESEDQINALTVLLIMDTKILYSNFLLFNEASEVSKLLLDDIENEVINCFHPHGKLDKNHFYKTIDSVTANIMPVIAHLKIEKRVKRLKKKLEMYLRQKLFDQIDSEILILNASIRARNGYIVCANLLTLEWLTEVVKAFPFNVSIDRSTQLAVHDFREVTMLSQTILNQPFNVYMKKIKKCNPNLRTHLWKCLSPSSDWKLNIEVDIHSIAYLELQKCRIVVDELVYKFNIRYISGYIE